MLKNYRFTAILALTVGLLAACTQMPDEELPIPSDIVKTIIVPADADAVVEQTITLENSWSIANPPKWVKITPLSGFAGQVDLKIQVLLPNEDFHEVEDVIRLRVGEDDVNISLIQRGVKTIELAEKRAVMPKEANEGELTVVSTVGFEIVSSPDWATVKSIASSDSILLSDGCTYSNYVENKILLDIKANNEEPRNGDLVFKGTDGEDYVVSFVQKGDKLPYRRTAFMRFTATWCGNCPNMAAAVHQAEALDPDRYAIINFYGSSEGGLLLVRSALCNNSSMWKDTLQDL